MTNKCHNWDSVECVHSISLDDGVAQTNIMELSEQTDLWLTVRSMSILLVVESPQRDFIWMMTLHQLT